MRIEKKRYNLFGPWADHSPQGFVGFLVLWAICICIPFGPDPHDLGSNGLGLAHLSALVLVFLGALLFSPTFCLSPTFSPHTFWKKEWKVSLIPINFLPSHSFLLVSFFFFFLDLRVSWFCYIFTYKEITISSLSKLCYIMESFTILFCFWHNRSVIPLCIWSFLSIS